jgi:uncharacterized protein involved in tolerance to divalent cations
MIDIKTIQSKLVNSLEEIDQTGNWPVNLHRIISRLGLALRIEEGHKKSRAYLCLDAAPEIRILRHKAATVLSTRERFSIAHELAHWVVWKCFQSLPSSEEEYWWHEDVCNEFAARLLVPRQSLTRFLEQKRKQSIHPIYYPELVAKSADVSWTVAAKSISTIFPETAFVRLRNFEADKTPIDERSSDVVLTVDCSTVQNSAGRVVGRGARLKEEQELSHILQKVNLGKIDVINVTAQLGGLRLNQVPCTVLRKQTLWIIHIPRLIGGVEISAENTENT